MRETLKTEEAIFEVSKKKNGTHELNIYHNIDEDMILEIYLSDREIVQLIKVLTRVHLGLKSY